MSKREIDFWNYIVRRLPKRLVYFSFIHVIAHSTNGKYGNTIVPELTAMDAIDRYEGDMGVE